MIPRPRSHSSPDSLDETEQLAESDGFGQVLIDADLTGVSTVLFGCVSRDHDDRRTVERSVIPHLPGDLVAIHTGQPEIEKDHIGTELRRL